MTWICWLGDVFLAYLVQVLCPQLQPGEVVNDLAAPYLPAGEGARQAI
jgi:hypothetical protein